MNDILCQGGAHWSIGPSRAQVFRMEDEIAKLPPVECTVREWHTGDMYVRELTIPKDTMLTGAIHKTRHICTISKGDITVWTEHGMQRLRAPCTFISEPGAKRVGWAHEETVFTTYHATTETDTAKLVEQLTDLTVEQLLGGPLSKQALMQFSKETPLCLSQP